MFKQYILYLLRWQLSTPILALVLWLMRDSSPVWATIAANLIGGIIFFWVDRTIFNKKKTSALWTVYSEENNVGECGCCHNIDRLNEHARYCRYCGSRIIIRR